MDRINFLLRDDLASMKTTFVTSVSAVLLFYGAPVSAFVFSPKQRRTMPLAGGGGLGRQRRNFAPLCLAEDDESVGSDVDDTKGFDGEGFAGYLAPYALALLASIAITAAFFKLVLLDY